MTSLKEKRLVLFQHFSKITIQKIAQSAGVASKQRDKTPTKVCAGYGMKISYGESPALELWGIWITLLLPLLAGPFWPGVVTYDRVLLHDGVRK